MRGVDSSAAVFDDDAGDVDDPSRVQLILQTKDSKAKKCSLVIFKVSKVKGKGRALAIAPLSN